MASKIGYCPNSGGCRLGLQGDPVEADADNFVCPACSSTLSPATDRDFVKAEGTYPTQSPIRAAIVIGSAVCIVAGAIWGVFRYIEGNPQLAIAEDGSRDFGTVLIGESASSYKATLKNTGTGRLRIKVASEPGGPFTCAPPNVEVRAGETATLTFAYRPTQSGEQKQVLHLKSNDQQQTIVDIELQGSGVKYGAWWIWDELDKTSKVIKPKS